jgi:hypothetical protein
VSRARSKKKQPFRRLPVLGKQQAPKPSSGWERLVLAVLGFLLILLPTAMLSLWLVGPWRIAQLSLGLASVAFAVWAGAKIMVHNSAHWVLLGYVLLDIGAMFAITRQPMVLVLTPWIWLWAVIGNRG